MKEIKVTFADQYDMSDREVRDILGKICEKMELELIRIESESLETKSGRVYTTKTYELRGKDE